MTGQEIEKKSFFLLIVPLPQPLEFKNKNPSKIFLVPCLDQSTQGIGICQDFCFLSLLQA